MSIVNKAYKFRIYPNDAQKQVFEQTFGNIRFIYNKFIFDNKEELLANKKVKVPQPTVYKKDFEFLKSSDSLALANNYLSMKKAMSKANSKETYVARQRKLATIHKDFADNKFSEEVYKQKLNNASKFGLLKYKRKSGKQSFTTNNQFPKIGSASLETVRLENDLLFIPKIKNGIKIIRHRQIKGNYKIKSVTITKSYNDFYEASILIEYESNVKLTPIQNITEDKVLGLDFSMPHKYINSQGTKAKSKDYFRICENKISALNNKISRNRNLNKIRFADDLNFESKNQQKLQNKLNKLHLAVKQSRKQENHILANAILNDYDVIVLEDINLNAMSQCLKFGKSLHDKGFGDFRNILKYKAKELGKYVVFCDRFFPSSKKCSKCDHKHTELKLSDRVFVCPSCNLIIDRDLNSAINLQKEGLKILIRMHSGEYALGKNRDPNKELFKIISESSTHIEPAISKDMGCIHKNVSHGNNKPLPQASMAR